ncbi:glycosyltransferase family 2 protein [bacterium]|nr:glycosyltransferase family 2 protein [bacterium]
MVNEVRPGLDRPNTDADGGRYDAVIRTDHHSVLLERVISALRAQTSPPKKIILVDASREPCCREALLKLGDIVIQYPNTQFNFAHALNLGIEAAVGHEVLLISSHVVLKDITLIEHGRLLGREHNAGVVYWKAANRGALQVQLNQAGSFDGHNGLSATCALIPRRDALERPFRTDVFSAEDQEWAGWYLHTRNGKTLQIEHPQFEYLNPNSNIQKTINEEIAIAYFTNRKLLRPRHIATRILRAALAGLRHRPARARLHWEIAKGLLLANFRQPHRRSRYY